MEESKQRRSSTKLQNMINIRFSLTNPWSNKFETVYFSSGKTPIKNKFWEIQIMKTDDIVAFDFRVSARTDHAGLDLWLGLLGYSINLNFYDNRHWDFEENGYK